jgi:sulfur carrier protein ThiS
MRVAVRTFGNLRRYLPDGGQGASVSLSETATIRDVLDALGIPENEAWRVSLNGTLVSVEAALSDSDEVSVFAPVGGG